MQNADEWVLGEIAGLGFKPYADVLPSIARHFERLRTIEATFRDAVGNRLTKRQAVVFGLLARSFQLSISCLVNQLQQNHAGWNCSYRSLMETFFVADWVLQDPQRLEAYFESRTPTIGRIKADCCARHPAFAQKYVAASQVTHVETRALHLPRPLEIRCPNDLPFTATEMTIAGHELSDMLTQFEELQGLTAARLQALLVERREVLCRGEVLWSQGTALCKFGCLAYVPQRPDQEGQSPSEGTDEPESRSQPERTRRRSIARLTLGVPRP